MVRKASLDISDEKYKELALLSARFCISTKKEKDGKVSY
jgi:hypothetical protein